MCRPNKTSKTHVHTFTNIYFIKRIFKIVEVKTIIHLTGPAKRYNNYVLS